MIFRIFYAIKYAWKNRLQLHAYINDPALQLANITDLSIDFLRSAKVKALALDFDGVLAAHGEPTPRPEVMQWLQHLVLNFTPNQVFVLSNKPTNSRYEFFKQHFPSIIFIKAARKKPYPDGLLQIQQISQLNIQNILLVDDRLLTGILASIIANTKGIWIVKPYINLRARPLTELSIMLLRTVEIILCKLY